MIVKIKPGSAHGAIKAPPSKSAAHRALIAAALAEGESIIRGVAPSQDILATLDCLQSMGISLHKEGDNIFVKGGGLYPFSALPCRESGSTLRFFLPLCLLEGVEARLMGSSRLLERPLGVYENLCREKGFLFRREKGAVCVAGRLTAGEYTIDSSVSSQFVSGLVFALLRLPQDSRLYLRGDIESRSYIDLTLAMLNAFGFPVQWRGGREIYIPGGCRGRAQEISVEGDYSNAAFFEALNYLGGAVRVTGLKEDSIQGDRVYRDYFPRLAAGKEELSLADCPDLGPVLMALAAALHGGVFLHTARLRVKESDRGAVMAQELAKFGAETQIEENRIIVKPGALHRPQQELCGHNDHRIVMALSVLCSRYGGSVRGAEAVAKSMPDFFAELRSLGIEVDEYEAE